MTNQEIAATILSQLGNGRFVAMTGAKNLAYGEHNLSMKIGRNAKGVTHVKITLDADDTYTVEFFKCRKFDMKTAAKVVGVYCDMLRDIFTDNTGLYTSL